MTTEDTEPTKGLCELLPSSVISVSMPSSSSREPGLGGNGHRRLQRRRKREAGARYIDLQRLACSLIVSCTRKPSSSVYSLTVATPRKVCCKDNVISGGYCSSGRVPVMMRGIARILVVSDQTSAGSRLAACRRLSRMA
jgi:hypothetical protein